MGRPRGQRGTLKKHFSKLNGWSWRGRFRMYINGASREFSMRLGSVDELSEEAAREALDEIVAKAEAQSAWARRFGVRGLLKQFVSLRPQIRVAGDRMKSGNNKGGVGAAAEFLVCADLLSKGIEVFRALNPQATCDLVCKVGDDYARMEVKCESTFRNRQATLLKPNREGKFDVLAIVSRNGSIRYVAHSEIATNYIPGLETSGLCEPIRGNEMEAAG